MSDKIKRPMPQVGDTWIRKTDSTRECKVTFVRIDDAETLHGFVLIKAPWMKCYPEDAGKSLDTFLKQYEKARRTRNV
jgi:hypothetical protein